MSLAVTERELEGKKGFTPTVEVPNVYHVASNSGRIEPSWFERKQMEFHIWMIQNPSRLISKVQLPVKSLFEGIKANTPGYFVKLRDTWGPNFCCAGEVVLGEWAAIEKALVHTQQVRTFRLGAIILDGDYLPRRDTGNKTTTFPLALSSKDAKIPEGTHLKELHGDGEHEAIRQLFFDVLFTPTVTERQNDETCQKLLHNLAEEYKVMDTGREGDFFMDPQRGLCRFFAAYIHYTMFGINPFGEDSEETLETFGRYYYETKSTVSWFRTINKAMKTFDLKGAKDWEELSARVSKIYEESPAFTEFAHFDNETYNNLTKQEFAKICMPLMGIAAMIGPRHLATCAMSGLPMPVYYGREELNETFDVADVWDKLDLDDDNEVTRYLYENARLWIPVTSSHHVAQEDFTVTIGETEHTFPKGTIINIPIVLGMLDEGLWGKTTFQFDHNRENLCPYSMVFNGVGEKHGGRLCPGKDFALRMVADIIKVVGKARRENK